MHPLVGPLEALQGRLRFAYALYGRVAICWLAALPHVRPALRCQKTILMPMAKPTMFFWPSRRPVTVAGSE